MTSRAEPVRIALVGDRSDSVPAHEAIPRALELAGADAGVEVTGVWMPTTAIRHAPVDLAPFAAVWAVPGSPYASMDGALAAIRFAR